MPRVRLLLASALWALALGPGVVALLAAPVRAQEPTPVPPDGGWRDQIVLSGDVVVRRGEEVGQVVVLHGTATIGGVVHGDVVVLDGEIEVTGQVSGSVVSISGPIAIGPNAQVLGDVIGRDRLRVAEGATIGGRVREGAAFTFRSPIDLFGPFAAWLAIAASTLALGALLLLFAPRGMEAGATATLGSPWVAAGIGLAVAIGLPVLGVVAVVTLVGLPFGFGLLLALALVYSVGFVASVFALGRALWRAPRSRWLALAIGWTIVAAASAIPFVGGTLWFVGSVLGLGGLTVATWRVRGRATTRGRHRPGGKMTGEPDEPPGEVPSGAVPAPMITERAMGQEGTGI